MWCGVSERGLAWGRRGAAGDEGSDISSRLGRVGVGRTVGGVQRVADGGGEPRGGMRRTTVGEWYEERSLVGKDWPDRRPRSRGRRGVVGGRGGMIVASGGVGW